MVGRQRRVVLWRTNCHDHKAARVCVAYLCPRNRNRDRHDRTCVCVCECVGRFLFWVAKISRQPVVYLAFLRLSFVSFAVCSLRRLNWNVRWLINDRLLTERYAPCLSLFVPPPPQLSSQPIQPVGEKIRFVVSSTLPDRWRKYSLTFRHLSDQHHRKQTLCSISMQNVPVFLFLPLLRWRLNCQRSIAWEGIRLAFSKTYTRKPRKQSKKASTKWMDGEISTSCAHFWSFAH